jgi:hypothetical protein
LITLNTTTRPDNNKMNNEFESELKTVFQMIEDDVNKMSFTGKTDEQITKVIGELLE